MQQYKIFKAACILFLVIACRELTGCHTRSENSFYTTSKTSDLWRFPLIQPYELVSPTNSGDWVMNLTIDSSKLHKDFFYQQSDFQLSDIESLGIKDSTIVVLCKNMYWPKLAGQYNSTVIIHVPSRQVFISADEPHNSLLNQLKSTYNLNDIKLHKTDKLINDFQASKLLPPEWPE